MREWRRLKLTHACQKFSMSSVVSINDTFKNNVGINQKLEFHLKAIC